MHNHAVIALLMVYNRPDVRPSNWNAEIVDRIILYGIVQPLSNNFLDSVFLS